jgi:hypothetical protein
MERASLTLLDAPEYPDGDRLVGDQRTAPTQVRGSRWQGGSILVHCASVKRTLRLALSATSGRCGTGGQKKSSLAMRLPSLTLE